MRDLPSHYLPSHYLILIHTSSCPLGTLFFEDNIGTILKSVLKLAFAKAAQLSASCLSSALKYFTILL